MTMLIPYLPENLMHYETKLNEKCTVREVILFVKKVWREVPYEERKCVACLSQEQKPRRYK